MTFRRLIRMMTLVILCTMTTPLKAQESGLQVTVTQAWQGHTRVPGWIEVEYIVSNERATWDGAIIVYDASNEITYRTLVSLPQHSRKAFRISLLSSDGYDLTSSLQDDDNYSQETILSIIPLSTDRVCAYIGSSSHLLQNKLTNCSTFLQLQTLAELPETPMVWDNVDVLIINGINTNALSTKQSSAMTAWVASGGHLVIGGGLALGLTLEHLPPILQIANPGPVNIYHTLSELSPSTIDVASSQLSLTPGSIALIRNSGITLAARKLIGKGSVDIIGWDVTQVESTAWLEDLWVDDPVPAAAIRVFGEKATSAHIGPSIYELQQIPSSHVPKLWLWLVIFIVYVFLIGPTTVWIIRRINKPIFAWVLIPGWITIALIFMSIFLSSTYGNTFPLIHDIAFISMNGAGLPARVIQGTAITAPQSRKLTWSSPGYFRPLWGQFPLDTWNYSGVPYPFTVISQQGMAKLNISRPNGMITWGVEGVIDGTDINAQLTLSIAEKVPIVTGTLYSENALENVSLVWFGNKHQILHLTDNVLAFDTVPISRTITLSHAYEEPIGNICGTTANPLRMPLVKPINSPTLQPAFEPTCYITAKTNAVPFPTSDIAGAYTGESCVIYTISCPTQVAGAFAAQLQGNASGNDPGWIDTEMDVISPYPPSSTYTYHLPDFINIKQVDVITISIKALDESESKLLLENDLIVLLLWDWQENEWITQSLVKAQDAGAYEVVLDKAEAGRFFDLQNRNVQIQLMIPNNTFPMLTLPIGIEGIW